MGRRATAGGDGSELDPASIALLDLHLPRDHPWTTLTTPRRRDLDGADVVGTLALLEAADVAVWVDGGWGVDALLGEQTRPHADLDIAVPTRHFDLARAVLADHSFVVVRNDGRYNGVFGDDVGRLVDVHAFDDTFTLIGRDGIERHGPLGLAYEAGGFSGAGRIEGRPVRCMSAQFQMRSHTGYRVDDDDWHDVHYLHRRFGLPIPTATRTGSTARTKKLERRRSPTLGTGGRLRVPASSASRCASGARGPSSARITDSAPCSPQAARERLTVMRHRARPCRLGFHGEGEHDRVEGRLATRDADHRPRAPSGRHRFLVARFAGDPDAIAVEIDL